jgi:phage/plasmid-like protein (TIGR03299 family)
MAHEVETLAYVGQVPWHGLGEYLGDEDVTGETMLARAGLNWTVSKRPVFAELANGSGTFAVPGFYAIVRDDREEGLGVVGSGYVPAQNAHAFAVPNVLQEEHAIRYHTAGSLRGGRIVFALAQLSDVAIKRLGEKRPGDVIQRFLLFSNTHTGKRAMLVGLTPVRVVCKNTHAAALSGVASFHKIRHVGDVAARIEEAHRVLLGVEQSYAGWQEQMQSLADAPMNRSQMRGFSESLLVELKGVQGATAEDEREARDSAESRAKTVDELCRLFESGTGNTGESRWDAFNAVTEYLDHGRKRLATYKATAAKLERHAESTLFGRNRRAKTRALRLLKRG